jgi:hypothetical protein
VHGIPPRVAASKLRLASFSVESEDPLFAIVVLEITNVEVRVAARDNRRITTSGSMMIRDTENRF